MSTSGRDGTNGIRHKLLSHLLGLEDEQQEKPKKWRPSLQGLKLSDALSGITFTQNFMWFVLFAGFFLWLFVIYWVRHNEPLMNQVLGEPKAHAPTAPADRELVAGIKKVLPVHTSNKTGDFYVPYNDNFGTAPGMAPRIVNGSDAFPVSGTNGTRDEYKGTASNSPYGPIHQPYDPARHPWLSTTPPAYVQTLPSTPLAPNPVQSLQNNYLVGVQTRTGTKVKTIVNH